MKYVKETKAAQSIRACVVFKDGQYIATVQAYFGRGTCTVNVYDNKRPVQIGYARGYGYDKFTAALNGLVIDGVMLNDHSGQGEQTEDILARYHAGIISEQEAQQEAKKIGADFANWSEATGKYGNLYLLGGLEKLKTMGYTVITAI